LNIPKNKFNFKTYQEGKGNVVDINLMLTAMLRYANINANPVLLSTRGNGLTISPTINGFNYVIVHAETDQGEILLDASDKYSAPNLLHPKTSNGSGRLVMKGGENKRIDLQTKTYPPTMLI